MRVTQRSGRVGSARHNDRSFLQGLDEQKKREIAEHIDSERSGGNLVLSNDGAKSNLADSELEFYRRNYSDALERRNEMYRQQRHPERCKSVEDLYQGKLTRPEELILQIGDMNQHVDEKLFKQCVAEYLKVFGEWNASHGNHGHVLNVSIHLDEATPHAHIRRVWDYQKNGLTELGQNKALELAGVPLKNPEKPVGRYNNRKITFDSFMRERWQEICKSHGLEIETEPRPTKKHKDKAEYISEQLTKQQDELKQRVSDLQQEVAADEGELTVLHQQIKEAQTELSEEQVKQIESKPTLFGNNVTVDAEAFKRLKKTAKKVDAISKRNEELEAQAKEIETLRADAQAEATEIISKAKREAEGMSSKMEMAKLNAELDKYRRLQEKNPELFRQMADEQKRIFEKVR